MSDTLTAIANSPLNLIDDTKEKKYSVTEVFGPTMQGEGPMIGRRTVFARLHFCDGDGKGSWCSWCDTKYTWSPTDPAFKNYERLTAKEIVSRVSTLYGIDPEDDIDDREYPNAEMWVTISGGNPVLQMDGNLVSLLKAADYKIQVETQGTIWKSCLVECDLVVVSPKAPSSGMNELSSDQIMDWADNGATFKIVVFDDRDYAWAKKIYDQVTDSFVIRPAPVFYLQCGTLTEGDACDVALEKYRWLVLKWLDSGDMPAAVVLPQLHVLIWGRRKGV